LTNLFADIKEDGFQLKDLGNFGLNLGMDTIGLIPGGGVTSKGWKIAKSLVRYVPRIMATLNTLGTVGNLGEISKSFSKLTNGDFKDITTEDFRNYSQAIKTVIGGSAGVKRGINRSNGKAYLPNRKNTASVKVDGENVIGLSFKNKNGKVVTKAFSGEDAEAIKAAEGDPKKINDIIKKYDELKDFEVIPNSKTFWHVQKPWSEGEIRSPFRRDPKVKARKVYESNKEGYTTEEGFWKADKKVDDGFINSENIKKANDKQ
jgi:hypothetical protein